MKRQAKSPADPMTENQRVDADPAAPPHPGGARSVRRVAPGGTAGEAGGIFRNQVSLTGEVPPVWGSVPKSARPQGTKKPGPAGDRGRGQATAGPGTGDGARQPRSDQRDLDTSKADHALMQLYDLLRGRNEGSFASLSVDERREYFRLSRRRSRARAKASAAAGRVEATAANIRDTLADAALMILATDAEGAAAVRTVLATVFEKRPGIPIMVERQARVGKLRPKMLREVGRAR